MIEFLLLACFYIIIKMEKFYKIFYVCFFTTSNSTKKIFADYYSYTFQLSWYEFLDIFNLYALIVFLSPAFFCT